MGTARLYIRCPVGHYFEGVKFEFNRGHPQSRGSLGENYF